MMLAAEPTQRSRHPAGALRRPGCGSALVLVGDRRRRHAICALGRPSGRRMSESWPELIRQTLSGAPEGKQAGRKLLGALYPVVQARVARVLWRARRAADRNVQQEVEDMTQDVFRALFDVGGRALQAWDPARG